MVCLAKLLVYLNFLGPNGGHGFFCLLFGGGLFFEILPLLKKHTKGDFMPWAIVVSLLVEDANTSIH